MPTQPHASDVISQWPAESREAAQLVVDEYGDPQEVTDSLLIWHGAGPWKRVIASRWFFEHDFPAPHIDAVESVIDYRVPPELISSITEFDGSVIVDRTAGEVSARCHDVQANFLALNLMHDIVLDERTVDEAREYYAQEFLNSRRKQPTPYMSGLRFTPDPQTTDSDERILSDEMLERAVEEGKQTSSA